MSEKESEFKILINGENNVSNLVLNSEKTTINSASKKVEITENSSNTSDPIEKIEKLVYGFITPLSQDQLTQLIEPLINYLSKELNIPVEAYATKDDKELALLMSENKINIGAFDSNISYIESQTTYPGSINGLATAVIYGNKSFHGTFWTNDKSILNGQPVIGAYKNENNEEILVKGSETSPPDVAALQVGWTFSKNPEILSIDGKEVKVSPGYAGNIDFSKLNNQEILFVNETSTSGYIYPKKHLENLGVKNITEIFADRHDIVIKKLYNNEYKFGVSYDDARRVISTQNPDVGEKVIAIGITKEIPNNVIAITSNLPNELKSNLFKNLIEGLNDNLVPNSIYRWSNAVEYVDSDYDVIRDLLS